MVRLGCVAAMAALVTAGGAAAQEMKIKLQMDRLYPSTAIAQEINVTSQDASELPGKAADYEVLVNNKVQPNAVLAVRTVQVGAKRELDPFQVYLRVRNSLWEEGDTLQVRTTGTPVRSSDTPKAGAQVPNFAMTLGPNVVPSQALRTGVKRAVGQLTVAFDEMSLTPNWTGARTYLRTASVISSDAKDLKSNVNLALGVERSLTKAWYIPIHAETKVLGDQVVDNASWVSSTGVTTLVPWAWTRGLLRSPVFDAPISPEFGLDAQLERRLRQDAVSRKNFLDKDAFRLNAHVTWARMRLLKGNGAGDPVEMEVAGNGWYLPGQHTGGKAGKVKIDRLEGLVEVSVLVPLSKVVVTGSSFTTPQKGTKSVVRIKYSHGANEANGFRHSSQLSLGIEVTGAK